MQAYWLKFTDGSTGHCEGQTAFDAVRIAEHFTGKTVDDKNLSTGESEVVKKIPYPASPMIWQFEHPVYGKTPAFCYRGSLCHGRGACPGNPSCTS